MMTYTLPTPSRQTGAALIVSLIMLVVVSIMGVASMQGSTLQTKMSTNSWQKTLARNAADNALRAGEIWLTQNVTSVADISSYFTGTGKNGVLHYTLVHTPDGKINQLVGDPKLAATWEGGAAIGTEVLSNMQRDPRYVIEYIGRGSLTKAMNPPNVLPNAPGDQLKPYTFRISAIGWGQDDNIYSVLESSYETGYGDGAFQY